MKIFIVSLIISAIGFVLGNWWSEKLQLFKKIPTRHMLLLTFIFVVSLVYVFVESKENEIFREVFQRKLHNDIYTTQGLVAEIAYKLGVGVEKTVKKVGGSL